MASHPAVQVLGRVGRGGVAAGRGMRVHVQTQGLVQLTAGLTSVGDVHLEALAGVQPQHTQELVNGSGHVLGPHHQHVPCPVPAERGAASLRRRHTV